MKLLGTISTTTYYIEQNFYIDIIQNFVSQYYEAWIWNNRYGIKDHIYSVPMEQQTYNEFLDLIDNTIQEDIKFYVDDHFDYEERKEFYAKNNILQSN